MERRVAQSDSTGRVGLRCFGRVVITVLLSLIVLAPVTLVAESLPEYRIKAGFILNFLKFTNIEHIEDKILLCVLDGSIVEESFSGIETKVVEQRSIELRTLGSPAQAAQCDVVFVARSASRYVGQVLAETKGRRILTIGEIPSFALNGGIVNFFVERNRFRFEVNIDALRRSRLEMSSKVLKLARIIEEQ